MFWKLNLNKSSFLLGFSAINQPISTSPALFNRFNIGPLNAFFERSKSFKFQARGASAGHHEVTVGGLLVILAGQPTPPNATNIPPLRN